MRQFCFDLFLSGKNTCMLALETFVGEVGRRETQLRCTDLFFTISYEGHPLRGIKLP